MVEIQLDPNAHQCGGRIPCSACARQWLAEASPAARALHEQLVRLNLGWDPDQQVAIAVDLAQRAIEAVHPLHRLHRAVNDAVFRGPEFLHEPWMWLERLPYAIEDRWVGFRRRMGAR